MKQETINSYTTQRKYFTLDSENKLNDLDLDKTLIFNEDRYCLESGKLFACIQNYQYDLEENKALSGKNLILVCAGVFGKITILSSFLKRNFKIFCLNHPDFSWASYFYDDNIKYINLRGEQPEKTYNECLDAIREYSLQNQIKFDGIITLDDRCTLMTAKLAKTLNLKAIDYGSAFNTYNKYEYKAQLQKNNLFNYFIKQISGSEIKNSVEFIKEEAASNFYDKHSVSQEKSYIMKDIFGVRKNFIRKFSSVNQLQIIFETIAQNESLSNKCFVIEDFFKGMEIDLDIIIQNNKIKFLAISENEAVDEINFSEKSSYTPSIHISDVEFEQIKTYTERILEVANISESALHFEAFCRPKALYGEYDDKIPFFPIECNLRIGGANVSTFMQTSYKYNLMLNQIKVAFDLDVEEYDYAKNKDVIIFCASRDIFGDKSGVIKAISFDKDFFSDENLVDIVFQKRIGDYIDMEEKPLLAFLIGKSNISYHKAIENVGEIFEKIKIEII